MLVVSKAIAEGKPHCIDCEHPNGAVYIYGRDNMHCFAPQNKIQDTINLVTGETIGEFHYPTCEEARKAEDGCSLEGRWFVVATPRTSVSAGTHGSSRSAPKAGAAPAGRTVANDL